MKLKTSVKITFILFIASIFVGLFTFNATKQVLIHALNNESKASANVTLEEVITEPIVSFKYAIPSGEEVIDTEKPVITFKKNIYIYVGNNKNLLKNVTVTDNSGEDIKATVEGTYDVNTVGAYKLKYIAVDSSNNRAEENFTLRVSEKPAPTTTQPVAVAPVTVVTDEVRRNIVNIAASQIGNKGGKPFWSWYGFKGRVEWCATFVSWVANQAGVLNTSIPKFAGCGTGKSWFVSRGKWKNRGYVPQAGDVIFFSWSHNGRAQHVGLVESSDGVNVYTIEGNSGDYPGICTRRTYSINSLDILGYGIL